MFLLLHGPYSICPCIPSSTQLFLPAFQGPFRMILRNPSCNTKIDRQRRGDGGGGGGRIRRNLELSLFRSLRCARRVLHCLCHSYAEQHLDPCVLGDTRFCCLCSFDSRPLCAPTRTKPHECDMWLNLMPSSAPESPDARVLAPHPYFYASCLLIQHVFFYAKVAVLLAWLFPWQSVNCLIVNFRTILLHTHLLSA